MIAAETPPIHLTSEVYNLQTKKWIQRKALLPNQLVFIVIIFIVTKTALYNLVVIRHMWRLALLMWRQARF